MLINRSFCSTFHLTDLARYSSLRGPILRASVCLAPVALHVLGIVNIHVGLALGTALTLFILAARQRAHQPVRSRIPSAHLTLQALYAYDHALLVLYSKVLALIVPELVIFLKDMRYVPLPWSFNSVVATCATVHLAFSAQLFTRVRSELDVLGCVLLAVAIELYCIYPLYRIVNFMCCFLLLHFPSLVRGRTN